MVRIRIGSRLGLDLGLGLLFLTTNTQVPATIKRVRVYGS
jgi:hypothetical protein